MVKDKHQAGFTLIEIVISVAIASGLLVIVFNGQQRIRESAQFSDAVERAVADITLAKNEANTTVNTEGFGDSATTGSYNEIFGKAVTFRPGQPIKVETLTANVDSAGVINDTLTITDFYSFTLPYGSSYSGPASGVTIVFARRHADGELVTYQMTPNGALRYTKVSNYPTTPQAPVQLPFRNYNNSRTAVVSIDPVTQAVTRVFN